LAGGAAKFVRSLLWLLWVRVARRPIDSFAIFTASAASLVIIVNAVALQSGARPAPFRVHPPPPPPSASAVRSRLGEALPPLPVAAPRAAPSAVARTNDPIAEFIDVSSRIMAVQRVLTNYGYGQIKPTGTLDGPTRAAIERFEREHQLPVTGRVSGRLLSELSVMSGRPIN
jgi:hypothetical protein